MPTVTTTTRQHSQLLNMCLAQGAADLPPSSRDRKGMMDLVVAKAQTAADLKDLPGERASAF